MILIFSIICFYIYWKEKNVPTYTLKGYILSGPESRWSRWRGWWELS